MGILEGKAISFVQIIKAKLVVAYFHKQLFFFFVFFADEHVLFELVQYSDVYRGKFLSFVHEPLGNTPKI